MNAAPSLPQRQQNHLTEDQLDDHLIGDLAVSAAGHLTSCALCTARVAEAAAPMASFRAVTLAWGQRQSATAPMPQLAAARSGWQRSLAWSLAVAACAVGLGLGLGPASFGRHAAPPASNDALQASASRDQSSTPSADQLSSDNQLLNTIDREVSASNENSATLGLLPVSSSSRAATQAALIRTSVQD